MDISSAAAVLQHQFAEQRQAAGRDPYPSLETRRDRLQRLRHMLLSERASLAAAIEADFGQRSSLETDLIDVWPTLSLIDYLHKHVKPWMKPEKRRTNLWFLPARSHVLYRPLGVVGVISPWNYPIFLSLGPVATALAAGNRVMLKVSELTPNFSSVLARLVAAYFVSEELQVVTGDAALAQSFSELPFNHLLYTGSTSVGRLVMQAAARNLTPVTLELGGKSPAIIHPGYDLEHAVQRILHGKFLNAGQTCVAPDYVLLPEEYVEQFVACARKVVTQCFPELADTPDYASIINERHYQRLSGYLDEAAGAGARVVPLHGQADALQAARKIAPTLVLGAPEHLRLMQDEIFGPILPLVTYNTLDEAIAYVRARPQPLAAYYFDQDSKRIARLQRELPAGGITVNDTLLHLCQDDLPFGGVGTSGMGRYHGREGFVSFSSPVGVLMQSRLNALQYFLPPYGRFVKRFLEWMLR